MAHILYFKILVGSCNYPWHSRCHKNTWNLRCISGFPFVDDPCSHSDTQEPWHLMQVQNPSRPVRKVCLKEAKVAVLCSTLSFKKKQPPIYSTVFVFNDSLSQTILQVDCFHLKWIGYKFTINSSNSCLVNIANFRQESLLAFIYEASRIQASCWEERKASDPETIPGQFNR